MKVPQGAAPVGSSVFGHAVAVLVVLSTLAYSWHLCLMMLLAWCVVTLGVAANLGQTEMTKLCSAHWLLVAVQIFALGSLISVNAWRTKVILTPELERLKAAMATQHVVQHVMDEVLLFQSNDELMIANLSSLESPVRVSDLTLAHSFVEFQGKIVFAARQGQKQQLWYIDTTECCTSEAIMLHDFGSDMKVETILAENSTLLIRASSQSCSLGQQALFASDGLNRTWEELSCRMEPGQSALLGEFFLAALPSTLLSCWCVRKPALFASLFLGIYSMVVIIRLLVDSDLQDAYDFVCNSLVVYSSLAYLAAVCWHWLRPSVDALNLKGWTFAVIALCFSAALQLRLDLPASPTAWRWIIFGAGGLLQLGIGQLVHQRWPKVMGLICLQLCLGRVVVEVQLDVGSAAMQAFQLGFLGLACGSVLVILGDWSLDPETPAEKIHPEMEQTAKDGEDQADAVDVAPAAIGRPVEPNAKVVPQYQRAAWHSLAFF